MAEEKNEVQVLTGDEWKRVVQISATIGHDLGADGDYRLVSAALDDSHVVLFEAVSGTDRYPPGRHQQVRLAAKEFDRLVLAVQKWRADCEEREAREREARKADSDSRGDYDPFLDDEPLP